MDYVIEPNMPLGQPPWPPAIASFPPETILELLEDILASKPFRTSKQCQKFLRYVVVHSMSGREEELKERVIGSEVLERNPDYNTADDPVVRIRAADVRKRLAMYYQDEGKQADILITIPSGSYRACFQNRDHSADSHAPDADTIWADLSPEDQKAEHKAETPANVSVAPHGEEPPALQAAAAHRVASAHLELAEDFFPKRQRKRGLLTTLAASAGVLVFVAFFVWQVRGNAHKEFNLFWEPMLSGSRAPILYVGNNAVYRLTDSFLARYQAEHPDFRPDPSGLESITSMDPNERLSFKDLAPNDRDFVGIEDVASAVAISSFFNGRNLHYDLRFGRDIVFGDFRTTPVVLIGAFNNTWTLELNDKSPYRFTAHDGIKRLEGQGHSWQTWYGPDAAPREDYALITREISPKSGQPVIAVAGLDQTGTRAAAEFVSSPALLDAALRKLPAGWQSKKMQLVLHATIVDYVPSAYDVIASSVQ
jgi:hypothetical protein